MHTKFKEENTIGQPGPEGGTIVNDCKLQNKGRVILEECSGIYAITSKIYGGTEQTTFCGTSEKDQMFEAVIEDLKLYIKQYM